MRKHRSSSVDIKKRLKNRSLGSTAERTKPDNFLYRTCKIFICIIVILGFLWEFVFVFVFGGVLVLVLCPLPSAFGNALLITESWVLHWINYLFWFKQQLEALHFLTKGNKTPRHIRAVHNYAWDRARCFSFLTKVTVFRNGYIPDSLSKINAFISFLQSTSNSYCTESHGTE